MGFYDVQSVNAVTEEEDVRRWEVEELEGTVVNKIMVSHGSKLAVKKI